jgi:hypothetical protein
MNISTCPQAGQKARSLSEVRAIIFTPVLNLLRQISVPYLCFDAASVPTRDEMSVHAVFHFACCRDPSSITHSDGTIPPMLKSGTNSSPANFGRHGGIIMGYAHTAVERGNQLPRSWGTGVSFSM